MIFNCRVLSAVKLILPDAIGKKSSPNEKVKRSSSSVATQSVKRRRGKFHPKSYNVIGWKSSALSKLSTFFFAIKEQLHEACI